MSASNLAGHAVRCLWAAVRDVARTLRELIVCEVESSQAWDVCPAVD